MFRAFVKAKAQLFVSGSCVNHLLNRVDFIIIHIIFAAIDAKTKDHIILSATVANHTGVADSTDREYA